MATKVKAITLHQPWASLIMAAATRFETRDWGTSYTGLLVIHAGKTLAVDTRNAVFMGHLNACIPDYQRVPLGAALGVVWLKGCWRGPSVIPYIDERERSFGNFDGPERKAWELAHPVAFEQPIPISGKQGLWDWPLPLPEAVLAQFEKSLGQPQ